MPLNEIDLSMDCYGILDLPPKASFTDIKKAYRKLALLHHPDKNGNDTVSTIKFQQVSPSLNVSQIVKHSILSV
jgi:curved DNA-binding protein CbpA